MVEEYHVSNFQKTKHSENNTFALLPKTTAVACVNKSEAAAVHVQHKFAVFP